MVEIIFNPWLGLGLGLVGIFLVLRALLKEDKKRSRTAKAMRSSQTPF